MQWLRTGELFPDMHASVQRRVLWKSGRESWRRNGQEDGVGMSMAQVAISCLLSFESSRERTLNKKKKAGQVENIGLEAEIHSS